ncbi:ubiquinol-cytochrome c reductase hinge protein, putative [Plasmodium ovale wallikeri]|uniref:Cytochrome b-c1 complex subunit 6 n=3 Tax=Plasmodium ovale TaxID=36330 RepID=A0A1A8WYX2_PLAOA|nr:ubiquinol-cytochrome c reductase hinge protein, putative [Plasmodium ovale curtisi]SBT45269.1 ubiquinol-cytochrome c reductase hinge protein, putative [Plasmodium ovale wallikeri]SBT78815.1 ubiquinol-cytochrome c reductase hinge protein, putative [Plasmodium ovale]SBS97548.1 ubiquinol-cytochrome c reductase hinge protein, putative [Plasmodium ovale curtisi]SBT45864.1 ubiquinol-cytochrome c reductase hinge protein, putative [Plasmodium ovale wallikeri]
MSYPYNTEFFVRYPKFKERDEKDRTVDPRIELEKKCAVKCVRPVNEYQNCVTRVKARTDNKGNCLGQYEELYICIDHCVAKDLFNYLV